MENLVNLLKSVENTPKTLEKVQLIEDFLNSNTKEDSIFYLKFISNEIIPYNKDYNIGNATVIAAICKITGHTKEEVVEKQKELGCLSNAVEYVFSNPKTKNFFGNEPINLQNIYQLLNELPKYTTNNDKLYILQQCFSFQKPEHARYICHFLLRDIKVGYDIQKLIPAVAHYIEADENLVQTAYNFTNSLSLLPTIDISLVKMTANRPFKPMLADTFSFPIKSTITIAEPKLDGGRITIHMNKPLSVAGSKPRVNFFTRKLEDVSISFPEIVKPVSEFINNHPELMPMIIDTEFMVGNRFTEFLTRIRRLKDIETYSKENPATPHVFDMLMVGGKDICNLPLTERIKIMESTPMPEGFKLVEKHIINTDDELSEIFDVCISEGYEGIMVKDGTLPYEINKRGKAWLKLKPTYTVDLYVSGSETGTGKNANLNSKFILSTAEGLTIGRVGSGNSDAKIIELTEKIKNGESIVFEIMFDSIQKSTEYTSGYALRLPRVVNVRYDKGIIDATKLEEIKKMAKIT